MELYCSTTAIDQNVALIVRSILIRRARGKDSLRLRRKVAAWDDDFLASLIAA